MPLSLNKIWYTWENYTQHFPYQLCESSQWFSYYDAVYKNIIIYETNL